MDSSLITSLVNEPRGFGTVAQRQPSPESASDVNRSVDKGAEPKAGAPSSEQELASAVKKINDFFQVVRRDLQFSIDGDSGLTVVKVVDVESGEVIRQIPSEEVLAIAASLDQARGVLFRAKA